MLQKTVQISNFSPYSSVSFYALTKKYILYEIIGVIIALYPNIQFLSIDTKLISHKKHSSLNTLLTFQIHYIKSFTNMNLNKRKRQSKHFREFSDIFTGSKVSLHWHNKTYASLNLTCFSTGELPKENKWSTKEIRNFKVQESAQNIGRLT